MRSTLSIFATILVLAGQARAFNSYVGCLDRTAVPVDTFTVSLNALATQDGAGCADGCTRFTDVSEYGYSVWSPGACDCVQLGGSTGKQDDLSDPTLWRTAVASGACASTDAEFWRLSSAWQTAPERCITGFATVAPNLPQVRVDSIGACQQRCINKAVMLVAPQSSGGGFLCRCTSGTRNTVQSTCAPNEFFQYTRTAAAIAANNGSGAYRRSLKETAKRQLAAKRNQPYCPDKMQACAITGSSEGYECMDTKYELESCGGCVVGEFGVSSSPKGADCTRLPGIPMGAVSCLEGKCVAYACTRGWRLQGGVCVKP